MMISARRRAFARSCGAAVAACAVLTVSAGCEAGLGSGGSSVGSSSPEIVATGAQTSTLQASPAGGRLDAASMASLFLPPAYLGETLPSFAEATQTPNEDGWQAARAQPASCSLVDTVTATAPIGYAAETIVLEEGDTAYFTETVYLFADDDAALQAWNQSVAALTSCSTFKEAAADDSMVDIELTDLADESGNTPAASGEGAVPSVTFTRIDGTDRTQSYAGQQLFGNAIVRWETSTGVQGGSAQDLGATAPDIADAVRSWLQQNVGEQE